MIEPGGQASSPTGSESIDPRVSMAAMRTVFAAERTYAAWTRTGLASLIVSVGGKTLLAGVVVAPLPTVTAVLLALFSAFCFAAAVWREATPGLTGVASPVRRLPPALLLTVNGILVLVSLAAVYGVIAGP